MSDINGEFIINSELWLNEKFDESKVLVDLIALAEGNEVRMSIRSLAKRWCCSRTKAINMINKLRDYGFVKYKEKEPKKEPQKEPPLTCLLLDSNSIISKKKKPKKEPQKEPPKNDEKSSILAKAIEIFDKGYMRLFGTKYIWDSKSAKFVGIILDKIKEKMKSQELVIDDELVLENFKAFLNIAAKDKWIRGNFSVVMLASKFNEIFSKHYGRDGTNRQSGLDAIERAADEILAKHAGGDIH